MKEISIKEIEDIQIGQTENIDAATGCTVILCEKGMRAGIDVRGGGPASRESQLLNPLANASFIHAVLLSGGSAFGLGAANGVMKYLEERNIGVQVGNMHVPLVCQADIFDLMIGDGTIRPDASMAYQACLNIGNYQDGNVGAGCGASVGKLAGMARAMKSGIGSYAIQIGELKIGAIVAVNAVGDIFDYHNHQKIAGMLNEEGTAFVSSIDYMIQSIDPNEPVMTTNTTIGAVITNAKFDKTKLCKIAGMSHNGYARSIEPVHTSGDGDTIFALSVGDVEANIDVVGTLAANVMSEAIIRAVTSSKGAYGLKGYEDIQAILK